MLAMDVNDNACNLTPRGVLRFIASMLAPTNDKTRRDVDPWSPRTCRYSVHGQAFARCFSLKSLAVLNSSPERMQAHKPVRYLRITAPIACIFFLPRATRAS